jgi:hypothetical protein
MIQVMLCGHVLRWEWSLLREAQVHHEPLPAPPNTMRGDETSLPGARASGCW